MTDEELVARLPIEDRLQRLERHMLDNWYLMLEAVELALEQYDAGGEEADDQHPDQLPRILDRPTFLEYVSLVAQRQHLGRYTGAEARALLYAAQLAYAALKGGRPDVEQATAALPQLP